MKTIRSSIQFDKTMDFDLFLQNNLTNSLEDELYVPQVDVDEDMLMLAYTQSEDQSESQEQPKPIEEFDFFLKSGDIKISSIPLPVEEPENENRLNFQNNGSESSASSETSSVSSFETMKSQPEKNVNTYYKNFLVILSGWIRNYFLTLVDSGAMSVDTFRKFQEVVMPPAPEDPETSSTKTIHKGGRRRKIYINLKKFSTLFNNESLKPHLSNFLNFYFLRYLMISKTANKSCLLRFLPVLKQGLIEGKISRLR